MKTKRVIFFIILLLLVGCSKKESDNMDNKVSENKSVTESKVPNKTEDQIHEETNRDQIVAKKWQIMMLEGQPVTMDSTQEQAIYFELLEDDSRVVGFAGCNQFNGHYTIEGGMRIRFSQMLTTLKSCPDSEFNERALLEVFELTDNYTLNDGKLSLNVARRAPLAVFEEQ